jgi:hypothetical protein
MDVGFNLLDSLHRYYGLKLDKRYWTDINQV